MKKRYCFLFFLPLLLTSCFLENIFGTHSNSETPSETPTITSSESETETPSTSISVSESISSYFDDNYEDSQRVSFIKAVFEDTEPVDRSLKYTNVFEKATYTYSHTLSDSYLDDNHTKLKDGMVAKKFDKANWAGYYGKEDFTISVDMNALSSIGDIEISMLHIPSYAIYLPSEVSLEVSFDDDLYIPLYTIYTPTDLSSSCDFTYRFNFVNPLSTQFMRFKFKNSRPGYNGFFFFSEITMLEYSSQGSKSRFDTDDGYIYDYYNYELEKEITKEVKPTDTDYNTYQNLALNAACDMKVFGALDESTKTGNTTDLSRLTNGVKATNLSTSTNVYFTMSGGSGRDLVIDLGNTMAIDKLNIELLNNLSASFSIPGSFVISLSNDGENFTEVNGTFTYKYGIPESEIYTQQIDLGKVFKARYVMISFVTNYNIGRGSKVGISEVEIFGYKNASLGVDPDSSLIDIAGKYPSNEEFNNVLFVYAASANPFTKDTALPYTAKLSEDGKITDYFFDTVIFAVNTTVTSSAKANDWVTEAIDYLFSDPNTNLNALNAAMEDVNKELGQNKKLNIFLPLLTISKSSTLDPIGGNKLDLSDYRNHVPYYKMVIDSFISKFSSMNYSCLNLAGFYDETEYMDEEAYVGIKDMWIEVNSYIHQKGYKSSWCPFFGAGGVWSCYEYGFDLGCLQPNYMFNNCNKQRLLETAKIAKNFGMAVELEIEDITNKESVAKFYEYLQGGYKYGYMNTFKMLYQGGAVGAIYYAYKDNYELYDIYYQFAKGTLSDESFKSETLNPDDYSNIDAIIETGSNYDVKLCDSEFTSTIVIAPLYGSYRINFDGSFTYYSNNDYQGYDYLRVRVADETGNEIEFDINITVTKKN